MRVERTRAETEELQSSCIVGKPKEKQHSLRERLEVVVSVDMCSVHHGHLPKHLTQRTKKNHTALEAGCDIMNDAATIGYQPACRLQRR